MRKKVITVAGDKNRVIKDLYLKHVNREEERKNCKIDEKERVMKTCPTCETFDPRPKYYTIKDGSKEKKIDMKCEVCNCEWTYYE